MKFVNTFFSKEDRYWLGVEGETGAHYVAIPVANQMIDYIENFRISEAEYENFLADSSAALEFADSCRRHEQDVRLFRQPGTDRGVPR